MTSSYLFPVARARTRAHGPDNGVPAGPHLRHSPRPPSVGLPFEFEFFQLRIGFFDKFHLCGGPGIPVWISDVILKGSIKKYARLVT